MRVRGRPRREDSKRGYVKFRVNGEDEYKLYELSEKTGMNKSELMRKALDNLYKIHSFRN